MQGFYPWLIFLQQYYKCLFATETRKLRNKEFFRVNSCFRGFFFCSSIINGCLPRKHRDHGRKSSIIFLFPWLMVLRLVKVSLVHCQYRLHKSRQDNLFYVRNNQLSALQNLLRSLFLKGQLHTRRSRHPSYEHQ